MSRPRAATVVRMPWILPESQQAPSPNYTEGRAGVALDTLVMHYAVDGDDFERGANEHTQFEATKPSHDVADVARLFSRRSRGASAHFAIGRDGSLVQMVALDDTAWHAGGGALPDEGVGPLERPRKGLMNRRSAGIEMCNAGWAVDKLNIPAESRQMAAHPATPRRRREWEVYPEAQIAVLEDVLALARPHFVVDRPVFVVGHEDVVNRDTMRKRWGGKVDPGPLFPWGAIPWERYGFLPIHYSFEAKAWEVRPL